LRRSTPIRSDKIEIAILRVGPVDGEVVENVQRGLRRVFPGAACGVLEDVMPVPQGAYNVARGQYHSSRILTGILGYVERSGANCVLGITKVDLYVPPLNFVFGEAKCPGGAAIVSLCRLRSEFYGQPTDQDLFLERSAKEAVHEVGHTLGLRHCRNPACVMSFSNNIQMVDAKECKFCERCRKEVIATLRT